MKLEVAHGESSRKFAERFVVVLRELMMAEAPDVGLVPLSITESVKDGVTVFLPIDGAAKIGSLRLAIARNSELRAQPPHEAFDAASEAEVDDLLGRIAGRLELAAPLALQKHRAQLRELTSLAYPENTLHRLRRHFRAVSLTSLLTWAIVPVGGAIAGYAWYQSGAEPPGPPERLGFENDADGWDVESAPGSKGCVGLSRTADSARTGRFSLQVRLAVDGTDPERRNGEARLELSRATDTTIRAPLDLHDRTVVAWIQPREAAGSPTFESLRFQLFVKDGSFKACYGPPIAASSGRWSKLEVDAKCNTSSHHADPEFDGRAIALLGIKIATSDSSAAKFSGDLYLDSVGW
jgi:hypothetical protein